MKMSASYDCKIQTIIFTGLLLPYLFSSFAFTKASHLCSQEEGGGVCPENTKCCNILVIDQDGTQQQSSGCLPYSNHIDGPGTCCGDDIMMGDSESHVDFGTACPGYYQCAYSASSSSDPFSFETKSHVPNTHTHKDTHRDEICILKDEDGNIVKHMPRYAVVPVPSETIEDYYGFPFARISSSISAPEPTTPMTIPVLAYYSSRGPIHLTNTDKMNHEDNSISNDTDKIKLVLIIIHGSGRNADGYLYAGMSASQLQKKYAQDEIMIIAPRFLVPEDDIDQVPVFEGDGSVTLYPPLQWNETDPIPHTWRYGASALHPWEDVSSYDAIDALVEHFAFGKNTGIYENLERVVVAGHSAGGQFTHRWALTSNSGVWGDNSNGGNENQASLAISNRLKVSLKRMLRSARLGGSSSSSTLSQVEVMAVVANPRSFCYLDERRFRDMRNSSSPLEIPSEEQRALCPTYNSWEWGLDEGE